MKQGLGCPAFDHSHLLNKESFCYFGHENNAQSEPRIIYGQWQFFLGALSLMNALWRFVSMPVPS